jgi:signal transduction histidine kinase
MSIRLRFTLLYNAILALTLAVFGVALYSIQAQTTYEALRMDMLRTSGTLGASIVRSITNPGAQSEPNNPPPPRPFTTFSNDQAFQKLPEREIVRILDSAGNLVASPFGRSGDNLPLSAAGLTSLQGQQDWWEKGTFLDQSMLIYSHPIVSNGKVTYIVQVARPLTERDRSLQSLAVTLLIASLTTILIAFGIGWLFSRIILTPIQRITQTARTIGDERDFTQRVAYSGPQDEVGQLATTFNSMLARLQDAYQQVAHSLEMQRDFVADVSHELRTPLTTLRGNLGLLGRTPPIPVDEQTDILTDMTDESDRMIRLVNDLLVLARADAGRSLARDAFPILPVLEETCRQARQLDPARDISLTADDLELFGDRDAFKQVLLVALDNALKHSSGAVLVSAAQKGALVEVRVQDHGEGIAPEKLEHIFDRFYRGEDATTIPGFGLGLPIAKSLVTAMGGEISMQSELGHGSTLVLTFPTTG